MESVGSLTPETVRLAKQKLEKAVREAGAVIEEGIHFSMDERSVNARGFRFEGVNHNSEQTALDTAFAQAVNYKPTLVKTEFSPEGSLRGVTFNAPSAQTAMEDIAKMGEDAVSRLSTGLRDVLSGVREAGRKPRIRG